MRGLLAILSMLASGGAALAASPGRFDCEGPLGARSSHAALVKAYGRRNVVYQRVEAEEGESHLATVLFPREPERRVVITWRDASRRRAIDTVTIEAPSRWTSRRGISIGTGLSDVMRLNGRPFTLLGFGWDYAGTVVDWRGGAMQDPPGTCRLIVRFEPGTNGPGDPDGDREFASDDPVILESAPRIYQIRLQRE